MNYRVGWSIRRDHVFVYLFRTYAPGGFQEAMSFLETIALSAGVTKLRGVCHDEAHMRVFRMRGWKFLYMEGSHYAMEYTVSLPYAVPCGAD